MNMLNINRRRARATSNLRQFHVCPGIGRKPLRERKGGFDVKKPGFKSQECGVGPIT